MGRNDSYDSHGRSKSRSKRAKSGKSRVQSSSSRRSHRQYEIFKNATILYCETSEDARLRMMAIIEEEIMDATSETIQIRRIKSRLDELFGPNWNCFMSQGRCWALKTFKPGTNLVLEYKGMVYDIFQAIDDEGAARYKGPTGYSAYG